MALRPLRVEVGTASRYRMSHTGLGTLRSTPTLTSTASRRMALTCQYCTKEFNKGEHLRVGSHPILTRAIGFADGVSRDMSGAVSSESFR